jgi:5-methylcytosine-specific restriction endonuclease McrA
MSHISKSNVTNTEDVDLLFRAAIQHCHFDNDKTIYLGEEPKMTRKKEIRLWKSRQFTRQKGKCYYCNCKMDNDPRYPGEYLPPNAVTIDHLKARHRGGTNDTENLVLACHECNSRKGHLTLLEFNEVRVGSN